jgi:hypothetical protein
MPTPLALTDSKLDAVFAAARPLRPRDRDSFLQALAAELQGREIGPGSLGRAIVVVQRRFLDPPLETAAE